MPETKLATCCYCGTRTALALRGTVRHELSCGSCGAPLRYIKLLRKEAEAPRPKVAAQRVSAPQDRRVDAPRQVTKTTKKKKKNKGFAYRLMSKIVDEIEDILD